MISFDILCLIFRYWIGVLKLLKSAGCRDEHLMLVLQLGDVRLLGEDNVLGMRKMYCKVLLSDHFNIKTTLLYKPLVFRLVF